MSAPAPSRATAFACVAFGLCTLAIFIAFRLLPEVQAASSCARATSLIEFQQARSMRDLIHVFSVPAAPCRAPMIAAMDAQNTLDLFGFIPAYALFLITGAAMLKGRWRRSPLVLCAVAAVAVGVIGDMLETGTQLRITDNIEASTPLLGPLSMGYWMKYLGLAAYGVVIALITFRKARPYWIVGGLGALSAIATLGSANGLAPAMTIAFVPFWLSLLVAAVLMAFAAPKGAAIEGEIVS